MDDEAAKLVLRATAPRRIIRCEGLEARIVLISGVVVGNVTATDSIRMTDKARVVGDVTAPRVIVEAGAAFRGRLEMGSAELGSNREARAAVPARRPAEAPAKAPPRLAAPSRVAAAPGAVAARVATAPPRPAAAPARTPPSLPRPEAAAAGGVASAPHPWAKKKLHRRS